MRNRRFSMCVTAACAGVVFLAAYAFAQEETVADVTETAAAAETAVVSEAQQWKQAVDASKQQLQAQKDQIKTNAQEARSEEKAMRDQIKQARESGDSETAKSLRTELQSTHQANVQQKKQDKDALKSARQSFQSDKKAARFDRDDINNDGKIGKVERRKARGGKR